MNHGNSNDAALLAIDSFGHTYSAFRNKGEWLNGKILANKEDLFVSIPKENTGDDHYQTIIKIWNKLPLLTPFMGEAIDDNRFMIIGYIYANYNYGAVLYLAFNKCGIVKCNGKNFTNITF